MNTQVKKACRSPTYGHYGDHHPVTVPLGVYSGNCRTRPRHDKPWTPSARFEMGATLNISGKPEEMDPVQGLQNTSPGEESSVSPEYGPPPSLTLRGDIWVTLRPPPQKGCHTEAQCPAREPQRPPQQPAPYGLWSQEPHSSAVVHGPQRLQHQHTLPTASPSRHSDAAPGQVSSWSLHPGLVSGHTWLQA